MKVISFNIPYTCEESHINVKELIENPTLVNAGNYSKKCKLWFENNYPNYTAFMTTSCTRALELIALSLNLKANDEIILSPFTFVGVGNAFANYGAKLVFIDIDKQSMNIDAKLIEAAITKNTKAIIAMHYASIPCDMEKIKSICDKHNLILIEDNAQGIQAKYNEQLLGSFGDFSCMSFDVQKNISCNEGGVLLCKNKWLEAVDVAYNNGSNKTAFAKRLVEKYEWINKGSNFAMSEYTAAVLYPLLKKSETIINERKKIWQSLFNKIQEEPSLNSFIPKKMLEVDHNAHIAYLKFENVSQRNKVLNYLNKNGIPVAFHYVPLDDSLEGKKNAKTDIVCSVSLHESNCLLRLPMHNYLTESQQQIIVATLVEAVK